MDAEVQRRKLLNLNRLQTYLIICGSAFGMITAVTAWAHGWLGLPAKVDEIKAAQGVIDIRQQSFEVVTNRVATLEEWTKAINAKVATDHDLLLSINQKLSDMDERQKETAKDVKDLKR